MEVPEHLPVVVEVFEEAEGGEQVDREVEAVGPDEVPHVGLHDLDPVERPDAELFEVGIGAIDGDDPVAGALQADGVPPGAAGQIQHVQRRTRAVAAELEQRRHLRRGGGEAGGGEHRQAGGRPEFVVVKPVGHR